MTYFRYVDDCFFFWEKNKKEIDELFSVFNKTNSSITFTSEKEKNDELAFLDVLVRRHKNHFLTSVYRKKTFTGNYINFHSFCSIKRKTNLIRTLCHQAYNICSKELFVDVIYQKQKLILNKKVYPQELVNKTINLHLKSLDKVKTAGPDKCLITFLLPYVNRNSRILEKNINQISKSYYLAKLRVIFLFRPLIRPGGKNPISDYK